MLSNQICGRGSLTVGTARRGADALRAPVSHALGPAHSTGVVGGSAAVPELRWGDVYHQLHQLYGELISGRREPEIPGNDDDGEIQLLAISCSGLREKELLAVAEPS